MASTATAFGASTPLTKGRDFTIFGAIGYVAVAALFEMCAWFATMRGARYNAPAADLMARAT